MDQTNTTPNSVYVRPGGTSYSWRFSTGEMPGYTGPYPVTSVGYYNVPGFNWYVTRGHFEYSANDGTSWTTYTLGTSPTFISNPANLWRFVDTSPADTTTVNNYGTAWTLQGLPSSAASGGYVRPDNAPTGITLNRTNILSTSGLGARVGIFHPEDTGDTRYGYWKIENQSVPNLFTLSSNPNTGNAANLLIGSGTVPAIGQSATVTVRYYDLYQTDTAGVPISGQGVSQQFTLTVIPGTTKDLNFGNDLPVNTYTSDDQSSSAIAKLSDGNFVVVWKSAGQDKSSTNYSSIHGQKFSSTGSKVGSEFLVGNGGSTISESVPDVAPLNAGRFAVTYQTGGANTDVAFRIVEADGTIGAEKIANTTTADNQGNPRIATLTDGSFVIVWGADTADIKLQQFSALDGTAIGSEVSIADASGYSPDITALSNGNYAVVWADGNTYEVMAQVGSGSAVDTGIAWSGYAPPAIAGLANGFVVVSESWDYDANVSKIDGIRYNNSGVAQGGIFAVSTKTSGGDRYGASVAGLSGGGFVAAWVTDADDFDRNGISGRRFNADGSAVDSDEFQVNEYRADDQSQPALCGLDNNLFAAAWTDIAGTSIDDSTYAGNIEARVLLPANLAPTFVGSTTTLNASQNSTNDITALLHVSDSDGGQTLTWSEQTAPSHGTLEFSGATASSGSADIAPGGSITYVPDSNYVGSDSFVVQVSDGSDIATRTISVTVSDTTSPYITSVTAPANGSYTAGQNLDFTVNFSEAVVVNTAGGTPYIALSLDTGGSVQASFISGSGTTALLFRYAISAGNLDNDGIALSTDVVLNAGTIRDAADNDASLTFTSPNTSSVLVDTIAPVVEIASPSVAITNGGSVHFTVNYTGADSISLSAGDITLNTTGTADGTVEVTGSGNSSRTVTISGITGDGTARISIAASTASDLAGNSAAAAGPSEAFLVDSTAPVVEITSPSVAITNGGSVNFTVNYTGADSISLSAGDVTLNKTGTADGTVEVTGSGNSSRTVTVSGITGSGTLSISIAADTASDSAGNSAAATGPSESFTVNSAPTVATENETITIGEGSSVTNTGTFSDLEGNATATLTASIGSITQDNANGLWSWSFNSADDSQNVTILIEDGLSTNSVTFAITVTNVAPAAVSQSIVTPEDVATNITLTAVDPGADSITNWVVTVSPTNGTLSGTAPDLVYTPATNFNGSDSFRFTATDSDGAESAEAQIDITVTPVNDAPVAGFDIVFRPDNTRTAKIAKTVLLANDSDPDSDTLTVSAVGDATPLGATVAMAGPFIVYTAPSTNAGVGSFSYTLSDGAGGHSVTNVVPVAEIASVPAATGPNYSAIKPVGNDFLMTFIGVPGHTYRVQYTTSASAPYTWNEFSPLAIYTAPTNGVFTHLDVNPPDSMRMYRAVPHP